VGELNKGLNLPIHKWSSLYKQVRRPSMISLKKYLDGQQVPLSGGEEPPAMGRFAASLAAYGSALLEMGNCSLEACPGLGDELKIQLRRLEERMSITVSREAIQTTAKDAQE
jgi:hypothetical protein